MGKIPGVFQSPEFHGGKVNMKKIVLTAFILGMLAIGPFATSADAFSIVTGESWQTLGVMDGANSPNGTPYFDNFGDTVNGSNLSNAGNFTQGTGAWATTKERSPNLGVNGANYLGTNTGAAITNFYFEDGTAAGIKLLGRPAVAGHSNVTSFGWYEQNQAGTLVPTVAQMHEIFAAGAAEGTEVKPINFTHYFGFYFKDLNSGTYYTQSSLNADSQKGSQHFALFRKVGDTGNSTLYIAIEDLAFTPGQTGGADRDYNDMYVQVNAVPLPGALLLLGAGMARLVAYARRRQDS
jgi:hypothetical protein